MKVVGSAEGVIVQYFVDKVRAIYKMNFQHSSHGTATTQSVCMCICATYNHHDMTRSMTFVMGTKPERQRIIGHIQIYTL